MYYFSKRFYFNIKYLWFSDNYCCPVILRSRPYRQRCIQQSPVKSKGVIQSQRLVTFPTWNIDWALHTNIKYQDPSVTFMFFKIFYAGIATLLERGVCKLPSSKTRFCTSAAFTVPLLVSADACTEIMSLLFFFHPEREPFRIPEAEVRAPVVCWRTGAWCPVVPHPCAAGVRRPRGRWALGVTVPPRRDGRPCIFWAVSVKYCRWQRFVHLVYMVPLQIM